MKEFGILPSTWKARGSGGAFADPLANARGFTLTEVLIATAILFSAISISGIVFKTTLNHIDRVGYHSRTAEALFFVQDAVRDEIAGGRTKGESQWGGAVYMWNAKELLSAPCRSAPPEFQELSQAAVPNSPLAPQPGFGAGTGAFAGDEPAGGFLMTLYEVTVEVREPGKSYKPRSFRYRESVFRIQQ
jgi:hypothetical protein